MSKTTWALIAKFILTMVAATLAFRFIGNPWRWVIILSVAGTFLNYLLGDLVILPSLGNVVASLADGLLAAATAYVLDVMSPAFRTTSGSLILFAVLVAAAEYFFHMYLLSSRKVAP